MNLPPSGKIIWDWQIGATAEAAIVPPAGTKLIDLDGFNVSAAKVAALKAQGIYTVCYINAGSYEDGRPDSAQYPAYLKIHYDSDWDEWFLDVKDVFKPNSVLAAILRNRIKMCKDKGFDALEPDNLQSDENAGGKVTLQQQLDFNSWLADVAHEHGLAIFQKNGPDKILKKDSSGKMMVDKFDGILNEECQAYNECAPLAEYVKRGKLALNVEYDVRVNCSTSNSLNINSIRKDLGLVGAKDRGYNLQSCP
ncbi:MAG: endo alpha-1,4 polygalactosaminidase [Calothrix sp. SM1_5_4]|nr:endo alpha-1,4 polygalactosaminidase [Calothrix sp. SM1_5_4]